MNRMRIGAGLLLWLCGCTAGPATAPGAPLPPPPAPTASTDPGPLIEAERAFARDCAERGIRDSFLAWFAEDGILFRPVPVTARDWYKDRPASGARLSWEPRFAALASSRDLGYTTGPSVLLPEGASPAQAAHGHFVSVWKRQDDGAWRVRFDLGIGHPAPDEAALARLWGPPLPGYGTEGAAVPPVSTEPMEALRVSLLASERSFSERTQVQGVVEAYETFAVPSLRFYRDGVLPMAGLQEARAWLARDPGALAWVADASEVSRNGDLGATMGHSEFRSARSPDKVETGYWVRVWTRSGDDPWRLVLDIVVPGG